MKPLVVLGDVMLDVDVDGTVDRLCPGTPAAVVDVRRELRRPGGAGLAALLAARSTDEVLLITAVADDETGRALLDLLSSELTVLSVALRGTTVRKTRVLVGGQSLVRLDTGDGTADPAPVDAEVERALRSAGAILVADYGGGVAGHPDVRRALTELAPTVPIVWDPHPRGPAPTRGARLISPNLSEARLFHRPGPAAPGSGRDAVARDAAGPDVVELAANLRDDWLAHSVAVTTGEAGAVLADGRRVRTVPVPVDARITSSAEPDTCGAGDCFAATVSANLLAGATVAEAVSDAVAAAARFIVAGGACTLSVPVDPAVPVDPVVPTRPTPPRLGSAFDVAAGIRAEGGRVVATGGCFDLLHPGHVSLLRQARALGDALIVCLNSDDSVRRLKGLGRPILPARDRARLLTELASVDAVAIFDEPSPVALLERLRPDVWVKGGDYAGAPLPESEVVHRHGGETVLIPTVHGYSTSRLVAAAQVSG
ncbi:rfaE bifunctional protein nucleotidyltransferase chain/domain [Actinoalloteichus hoggarensis]|uniref:Bifunctional protein HldE n=1 Tax=Actinoalloteichus hoggarensis TaxID=1470176 RepID=A0A221W1D7_9PSEU|nr:PfkB family carbohydrate kinase [Actinoalloteichus hoggarensis]ASO19597.1 Bifunctional protein HldE [Actinoalloteichus hoggarensis]MBB5919696.1 rfaE bifunctional protein nucleotidyltransferase chain/domain [Actinoalloteichus hoggarensis]